MQITYKKGLIILSLLLILSLSLSATSATDTDISVSNIDDISTTESGLNNEIEYIKDSNNIQKEDSFHDLNKTYSEADNSLILTHDYKYYEDEIISEYSNYLIIQKSNFIFDDNGHTIDGSFKITGSFKVTGENVTIKNLNFINCYSLNGNIIANSKSLIIYNCNFTNCFSEREGAAILGGTSSMNSIHINNCNFIDCYSYNGGAISIGRTNDSYIINSNFLNCTASNKGGAIFMGCGGNISNCSFINCVGTGGAINLFSIGQKTLT